MCVWVCACVRACVGVGASTSRKIAVSCLCVCGVLYSVDLLTASKLVAMRSVQCTIASSAENTPSLVHSSNIPAEK